MSAETFGWDLVSCAALPELNDEIARKGLSPPAFSAAGEDWSASGTFGTWRVGPQGSGSLVHLELPISRAEYTHRGTGSDVSDALATIEVELAFIPSNKPAQSGGKPFDLVIKCDGPVPVSVLDVVLADGRQDPVARAVLRQALTAWLDQHLAAFAHVFASASIWSQTDIRQHGWLKPRKSTYAFCAREDDPQRGFLAILCKTTGDDTSGLVDQASPDDLRDPFARSAIIGPQRMCLDLLVPALAHVFPGLENGHFSYDLKAAQIRLDGPTKATRVKVRNKGKKCVYDVVVSSLTLEVGEDGFALEAETVTEISPGIYSHCISSGLYTFGLKTRDDGTQSLKLETLRVDKPQHFTTHAKWVKDVEAFLLLSTIVFEAVAGVVTGGLADALGVLALGLLLGWVAAEITIKQIEDARGGDGPPIDMLVANVSSAVLWPHLSRLHLEEVRVDAGLVMSGSGQATPA